MIWGIAAGAVVVIAIAFWRRRRRAEEPGRYDSALYDRDAWGP